MTAAATLALFCDRCGQKFVALRLTLECPACLYANYCPRVVLGHTQSIRL